MSIVYILNEFNDFLCLNNQRFGEGDQRDIIGEVAKTHQAIQ